MREGSTITTLLFKLGDIGLEKAGLVVQRVGRCDQRTGRPSGCGTGASSVISQAQLC